MVLSWIQLEPVEFRTRGKPVGVWRWFCRTNESRFVHKGMV
jgi:hypothetical protein